MKIPVDFEAKVKQAKQTAGGGYPTQLSARDLMQNFVFASADFEPSDFAVEVKTGSGGHQSRKVSLKLKIPAVPTSGTHVLGAVNGTLKWLATEAC